MKFINLSIYIFRKPFNPRFFFTVNLYLMRPGGWKVYIPFNFSEQNNVSFLIGRASVGNIW